MAISDSLAATIMDYELCDSESLLTEQVPLDRNLKFFCQMEAHYYVSG